MIPPQNHSISKGTLCLKQEQYRLVILIRSVWQKNKNQAKNHLTVCKNNELLNCNCHLIQ